jgi:hypothetical protein
MEKAEELIKIVSDAYITRYHSLSRIDKIRFLAAMEAYLIILGVIPAGQVGIPYKEEKKKFLGFIPYTSKENYEEYVLRLTGEYIYRDEKN